MNSPPRLAEPSGRIFRRSLVRAQRLRDELAVLRARYGDREDLPGMRSLVEAMTVLTAEVERELVELARELWEAVDRGHDDGEAHDRFRGKVGGLMNAVEDALPSPLQVARNPHGREVEALIGPFTGLIARLLRDEAANLELIFEPADDYGFQQSLMRELEPVASQLSRGLRDLIRGLPQLTVIAYPEQLEAETLIHLIMAHEAAHAALDLEVPAGSGVAPVREAFDEAVSKGWKSLRRELASQHHTRGAQSDALARDALDRLQKWYEELVCDALAVVLVGPAYTLALADLDAPSDRWIQLRGMHGHDSHPGLAWRLSRAIDLGRTAFLDAAPAHPAIVALRSTYDRLEESLPDTGDELLPAERRIVEDALAQFGAPQLRELAGTSAAFSAAQFHEETPIVWDKLIQDIPPAERVSGRSHHSGDGLDDDQWSIPMGWRSIMNGAYAYWSADRALGDAAGLHHTRPDHPTAVEDWIAFNAFVRGSIELADLHERLRRERDRLDALNPIQS